MMPSDPSADLTREQLITELETLRATGAFEHVISLRNRYPAPSLRGVSDKQLLAAIHKAATEWEVDILELPHDGD